ncbi:MAG: DUF4215 domain-containing protein [Deltaproteobacteria bacterium]|nr:DUF4215 domain-containing protein [Deltaproteobacteria bacterium]MBN2671334.1 DUF4215 domain-containing protein [Deltaproteobacteria bacterium]
MKWTFFCIVLLCAGSCHDVNSVDNDENDTGGVSGQETSDDSADDSDVATSDDCLTYNPLCCGNGSIQRWEACDDGNRLNDDGCTEDCLYIDDGYRCDVAGALCVELPWCGDGITEGAECCDDGNTVAGDGCSAICQFETEDLSAVVFPDGCELTTCGDGIAEGTEECDFGADENTGDYNGCTIDCRLGPHCGDGILDVEHEECDDGNHLDGDGCPAGCRYGIPQ